MQATPRTGVPGTLLCLGDSNTWGYDPCSRLGSRYPASVRWTGRVERAGWRVRNFGQNGLSIPRGRQREDVAALVRSLPADAVTVMLGSNDLLLGATAQVTAARMGELLGALRDATPAKLVLLCPPVFVAGTWVQQQGLIEQSEGLAPLYEAAAKQAGAVFADTGLWGLSLCFDGVHLTAEGHAAFAEHLLPLLSKPDN